ncbi:MAG TPA: leucine-rich repeat domain-containing protein [Candidatus Caccosoma faecigallinarum]|uniref:Leucine-rich repeat domain-containing protein n=1 Tax=Candidatus Caccosoma faecigallinarum TaxID=2840720 RepID=A0A9D1KAK7_9FIRM|nr:leucine-rich repeat domain-containing protein [Candidatus Caccosoma faecigallinarum]
MKKIYNKVILSSFLLMGFLSGCGSVANGTKTYSYEYDYKEVEGGLEITGIRYNKKNKVLDITIPNEIRDKKVISIAPNALKDVDIIRHVIMGANIQNIGQEAFSSCDNLVSITFPTEVSMKIGDRAFENTALTSIQISNQIELGNEVYKNCQNVTSIQSNATVYGEDVFVGCQAVTDLTINFIGADSENPKTLDYLFGTIPTTLKTIKVTNAATFAENTFANLSSVTSIELPTNRYAKTLPEGLFAESNQLTKITIPFVGQQNYDETNPLADYNYSLAYLFDVADNSLLPTSLKEVVLHPTTTIENVKYGQSVIRPINFSNSASLTTLTLNSGVETIEASAFDGCSALENITLSSSLTRIGKDAFKETKYYTDAAQTKDTLIVLDSWAIGFEASGENHDVQINNSVVSAVSDELFKDNPYITSVRLSNVKTLGNEVFKGATNLKSVDMNLLTDVPASTFEDCTSLTEVNLPRITNVGARAFANNTSLTSMNLSRVTSIAESAFEGCTQLETITISRNLNEVGANAFLNTALSSVECININQAAIDALKALVANAEKYATTGNELLTQAINALQLPTEEE